MGRERRGNAYIKSSQMVLALMYYLFHVECYIEVGHSATSR